MARQPTPPDLPSLEALRPDAIARFVGDLQGPVHGVARAFFGGDPVVEDVAQETFLKALRGLASYDPARGTLRTWVVTIARNLCRDHLRGRRHRETSPLPVSSASSSPLVDSIRADLDRALLSLPSEQRVAFLLMQVYAFPASEVAAIERVAEATIRSRCARAREVLRTALAEHTEAPS